MNAPNPVPPPASGGDARSYEPSMEEILASIRRIIADDQSLPGRLRAEDMQVEPVPASVHVLRSEDASQAEASTESQAPSVSPAEHPEPTASAMMAQGSIAAPQFPSPEMPVAAPVADARDEALALPEHDSALHFEALGGTAEPENETHRDGSGDYIEPHEEHDRLDEPVGASLFSATTNSSVASAFNVLAASRLADNSDELLGMARDMIRPLLRSWLDDNLPSMVERMVREEIERVARGGH